MVYNYKKKDNFWDIESLSSLFTVAFYYPKGNYIILSYLDDNDIILDQDVDIITDLVKKRNKNFNGKIYLENLKQIGNAYSNPQVPGLQTFIQRVGFGKNGYRKDGQTMNNQVINGSKDHRDVYMSDGTLEVPEIFYPVKDTDPEYDPEEHGLFFGYNSTNYDLTMLSHFITNIGFVLDEPEDPYRILDTEDDTFDVLSAQSIRDFNDTLFEDDNRRNMPGVLAESTSPTKYGRDYQSDAWLARKAWQYTNRFIDIAALNETMFRVGLKRLLGMLGHQILEFDGLSDGAEITTREEAYELLAYNVSDVINSRWLFEHRVYQNNFQLKSTLLKDYPETIYQRKPKPTSNVNVFVNPDDAVDQEQPYEPNIHYRSVDRYRLTTDSTSAKFVEKIIAPYNKMSDSQHVSFMYPSKEVAEQLTKELGYEVKSTDVLEDTKDWFEEHVAKPGTQAHDEFMEIYNFYDSIRGRNFNDTQQYFKDHGHKGNITTHDNNYVRRQMQKYNTNLFYFDKDSQPTSCLANFSIGGIHGAEIHQELYDQDIESYHKENKRLQFVKDQFDGDALKAINGDVWIKNIDGEEQRIRDYMKSGSTRKKASWREVPKPELFRPQNKVLKINKKYNYVSVGPSQHEDFTSYYPLLLTRLSVFDNPERGEGVDPYFAIFERRFAMKQRAEDPSLPEEERAQADLIQDAMKLLLNAATGAADATFENNIVMNNNIISMRIIGQLFAWRIGQAQTLAGARVPSTNTDGLYIMDLDAETNAQILKDISKDMYVGIEPEPLDRFITKDSNNRLEIVDGQISSAKGGTLNSWGGPEPTQSLAHPSAVDRALAYYLRDHEDPANSPFDRDLAKRSFAKIVSEFKNDPIQIVRHFQWILSSSTGTHQYIFEQVLNKNNPEEVLENNKLLQFNRVFLTKPTGNKIRTVRMANRRKVNPTTAKKRKLNGESVVRHDPIALEMLLENGFDIGRHGHTRDQAGLQKVRAMPDLQNVHLYNESLYDLTTKDVQELMNVLDIDAYIELLENTFTNSWSNIA